MRAAAGAARGRTPRATSPALAPAFVAAAVAAALPPAHAQSVTLYGLVDVALEHVGHVGAGGGGLTRVPSLTGTFPSRLGLRGSEDLGGGLRAVFTIEQGFTPDMGTFSQGGRAFGRQAWVGLTGDWGTFSAGRQYTMLYWALLDADLMGPGLYGSGSLDAYIPNSRADNALAWRGSYGPVTAGITYSFGRDTVNAGNAAGTNCPGELAGDSRACREGSAMLKADLPGGGAALAVDVLRGGPGAYAGLVSSALKDTRVSVNGYVKLGAAKLTAGLVRRDNQAGGTAPRSDLGYLQAACAATPALVIDGGWFRLGFKRGPDAATLATLRATYSLSRRTALYATAGHIANHGALALSVSAGAGGSSPLPGTAQSALAAGLRHSF